MPSSTFSAARLVFDHRALDEAGLWSRWKRNEMIKNGEFPRPDFYVGNGPKPRPHWKRETIESFIDRISAAGP